jgi:hypothetical protein
LSVSNGDMQGPSGVPAPALVNAVKRVLRPLVGLLLDNGLTYTWLTRILKSIYIDVAVEEFGLPGKEQTDSRITLLTGVHRKDVRRMRNEAEDNDGPPASIFIGARLVSIWTSEERFLDGDGFPAPLSRLASQGDDSSFEELVTLVSKDIRPRAFLDEWLRLGAVEIDDEDRVCLKIDAFIPARGFEEKAYYLGKNIHDHLSAARVNVSSDDPPFLERSVYYDELSQESVKKLVTISEKEAMKMLQTVNREARKLQRKDKDKKHVGKRMNFGVYFFDEEDK